MSKGRTNLDSNPYSRAALRDLRRRAMQVKGATKVCHLYPRAYCVAKPAPLCAVFVTPWMDSEPQIRTPDYSASHLVHAGVDSVRAGDWCALAYVVTAGCMQLHAFPIERR